MADLISAAASAALIASKAVAIVYAYPANSNATPSRPIWLWTGDTPTRSEKQSRNVKSDGSNGCNHPSGIARAIPARVGRRSRMPPVFTFTQCLRPASLIGPVLTLRYQPYQSPLCH